MLSVVIEINNMPSMIGTNRVFQKTKARLDKSDIRTIITINSHPREHFVRYDRCMLMLQIRGSHISSDDRVSTACANNQQKKNVVYIWC